MSVDSDLDGFITRREFNALADDLLRRAKAQAKVQANRQHFERERNALITQGRWAPPLPDKEAG
jgi:hypothetical protein